jgi:hypothetical protein
LAKIKLAVSLSAPAFLSVNTSVAPRLASSKAIVLPMPRPAPVIMATFPSIGLRITAAPFSFGKANVGINTRAMAIVTR